MSIVQLLTRGLVGDAVPGSLADWDDFDLDAEFEAALRRDDWIEPSW